MQKQKSGFTPLFLVFLICTQQMAWQGYGQVNRTVVDTIMGYINTNVSQHTGDSSYGAFNTAFSDELNRRWDPAWNVFTIKTTSAFDTVLYGYAFRDQWMWYNDYRVNGVVLAFVIWKDYNCQGWQTVGKNGLSTGLGTFSQILSKSLQKTFARSNIWSGAKSIVDSFLSQFGQVVSVVVSQDADSNIYGRVCIVESKVFSSSYYQAYAFLQGGNDGWGNALIFQTR